jgi:hypothetical protein
MPTSSSDSGSRSPALIGWLTPGHDGEQPERDERRGPRPGAGTPEGDQRRDAGGQQDDGAHALHEHPEREVVLGFRLRRGHPFEQMAPRHEAYDRPRDRVRHEQGLVRQQRHRERGLGHADRGVGQDAAHVAALGDAAPARDHVVEHRDERGQEQRGDDEHRPHAGRADGMQPACDEQQEDGGGDQRPPQVVEHLPAPDRRDAGRGAAEGPGQQLPVATGPAVLADGRDQVARRKLLEQRHVGDEARTREQPLEEVVAQQRVLGYPARERLLECVDGVDTRAGVRSLAEEVLVHVGDGGGVGIDAARAGEDALIE